MNSPRILSEQAREAVKLIQNRLETAQVDRINYSETLYYCVLAVEHTPTAVFWQEGPISWGNLAYSPGKVLPWYPNAIAKIILKGLKLSITAFGKQPDVILTPYT